MRCAKKMQCGQSQLQKYETRKISLSQLRNILWSAVLLGFNRGKQLLKVAIKNSLCKYATIGRNFEGQTFEGCPV